MFVTRRVVNYPVCLVQQSKRSLFYWINLQFNAVDEERKKLVGADRTCAEWILRNGGAIKWVNSEVVTDYNELPKEGTVLRLQEVDASNTSVMGNGFEHFRGCNSITKAIFHNCNYLEDNALEKLNYLKKSLLFLQLSRCGNITEKGLLSLNSLDNLKELVMYDLQEVKDKDKVVQALKSSLPKCNIKFDQ